MKKKKDILRISERDACELPGCCALWELSPAGALAVWAVRAGCARPAAPPGPGCSGISCFLLGLVCFWKKKKEYKLFCYGFIPECEQNFLAIILPKSFFVMGSGCHSNRLLKISKKFSAHGKPISQTVSIWIGKSGGQLFIHTQFNWGLT